MNTPEVDHEVLSLKSLKRPSDQVFHEIDGIFLESWNLTPKDEDGVGRRSYKSSICGVSMFHSEIDGVLFVALTISEEMGGFANAAAASAVKQMQETLEPFYGGCDVRPEWVGRGRGSVLVFGAYSIEDRSRVIDDFRPRVVSVLPYPNFA